MIMIVNNDDTDYRYAMTTFESSRQPAGCAADFSRVV